MEARCRTTFSTGRSTLDFFCWRFSVLRFAQVLLLALPVLFLYHELAWKLDWPLLIGDIPGMFESRSTEDKIMFIAVAAFLPLGAIGTGLNLIRMEGSRFFGVVLIVLAVLLSLAIFILRPEFRV